MARAFKYRASGILSRNRMASGHGAGTIAPRSSVRTLRLFSSTGTRPRLGAAGPGVDCPLSRSGRPRRLANRAPMAAVSPTSSGPGHGAASPRRASMPIWIFCSTLRSTWRLVLKATALSAVGRWPARFGNGRPPTSHRFPASLLILMKIIRSHGLARGRCCAAVAGQQAYG